VSAAALAASRQPLADRYDGLILDLDGVLQFGDQAVPYAVDVMAELAHRSAPRVYLTNNAARPPAEVAARLVALGIPASEGEVLTSAMVAADVLAARFPADAEVLVVGGSGLVDAVRDVGLRPVAAATAGVVAVVQGLGHEVGWALLAEGAVALRAGAAWVATNTDSTLPSPRGPLPGNGALVAALRTATGLEPEVVGKPQRGVFDAAAARAGGRAPLMVGDRLDTDIAGARAAGLPALLVLTGVSTPRDLLASAPEERPTYVGLDLRALLLPHEQPVRSGGMATCGSVTVSATGAVTGLDEHGVDSDAGRVGDGLRAASALAWAGELPVERYDVVLRQLGLEQTSTVRR
jgi:glycerol-1-phosphatase